MDARVENFLANWIDANIVHAAEPPDDDATLLAARFFTDAVASGLTLEAVNANWNAVSPAIAGALHTRQADRP